MSPPCGMRRRGNEEKLHQCAADGEQSQAETHDNHPARWGPTSLRHVHDGPLADDALADRGRAILLVAPRCIQAVAGRGELPSLLPLVSRLDEEERSGIVRVAL